MYKIIKTDGTQLGYTAKPHYIRLSNSGCFIEASSQDAIGIAFDSIAYNLIGNETIEDAGTVMVIEMDEGPVVFDHESRVAVTEQAAVDLDIAYSAQIAELESALCDMDKGGTV